MENPPILELKGLTKRFGYFPVLRGVDLSLRGGELLLLLGPNGAGKTTLTKILSTLSRPERGEILLDGRPLGGRRADLRRRIGYLSHHTFLYAHLTARENLEFFGALYGVADLPRKAGDLLSLVGLVAAKGRRVGTFSRGMQQRLSLARVLLTDPTILILDEPYTGLDPEGTRTLTRVLEDLKAPDRTLLLITHELEACLPIADRIAILSRGAIAASSAAAGLDLDGARELYREAVGGPS